MGLGPFIFLQMVKKSVFKDKKGVFDQLGAKALAVVTFVIILALGALVLSTIRASPSVLMVVNASGSVIEGTASGNTNATLFLTRGLSAVADFSSWLSILVIVTIFAVILAMVYSFYKRRE